MTRRLWYTMIGYFYAREIDHMEAMLTRAMYITDLDDAPYNMETVVRKGADTRFVSRISFTTKAEAMEEIRSTCAVYYDGWRITLKFTFSEPMWYTLTEPVGGLSSDEESDQQANARKQAWEDDEVRQDERVDGVL